MTTNPRSEPRTPQLTALQRDLLQWFDGAARDLPWRRQRSLYGTWISEMMLQQTTVATVVPYWVRFLARFPDVGALAAAPEADVLALWSGLGYYRRARQLQAAARIIVERRAGILPDDHAGWLALPGVGPYAAGAVASIGLGQAVPAVDANVRRVLGRWLGDAGLPAHLAPRQLATEAARLVVTARPGTWNEAMMELGALVCTAQRPACDACPVRRHCGVARADIAWAAAPREGAAAAAVRDRSALPVAVVLVALRAGPHWWLETAGGPPLPVAWAERPARDDFRGLHAGLLTLPMTAWFSAAGNATAAAAGGVDVAQRLVEGLEAMLPPAAQARVRGRFRHAITRYRLRVTVLEVVLADADAGSGAPLDARPAGSWVAAGQESGLNISQLTRKAFRYLTDARG